MWGITFDPGTNLVDVTLCRLRAKLPGLNLVSVRGVGYLLDARHPAPSATADDQRTSGTG